MKQYYYSDSNQQLGPFTFEELKTKRIKKSTLVWTDGLTEWTVAENLEELKNILISEPPPLPVKTNSEQYNHVKINLTSQNTSNTKPDYEKDIEATIIGIILLITPVIIKLTGVPTFETEENYNQARLFFAIAALTLRGFITIWVVEIAKRQNRNYTGWGWFAFFLPSISLIIIGLLNKLPLKIEIDGSLSREEQLAMLKQKADDLKSNSRHIEAYSILLKIKDLNENFPNIDEEIEICKAKGEQQTKSDKLKTSQGILENGQIIEFTIPIYSSSPTIGCQTTIDGEKPKDCIVKLQYKDLRYEIKDGKLNAEFYIERYKQTDGSILELDGNTINGIVRGSRAWINGEPAPDGIYKKGFLSKVTIENGVIL